MWRGLLPLTALLLFVSCQAKASFTEAFSFGPGAGLSGKQSFPFLVTNPGSINVSFSIGGPGPEAGCEPIDEAMPFQCEGSLIDDVIISPGPLPGGAPITIEEDVQFSFPNGSGNFDGFLTACAGMTVSVSSSPSCDSTLTAGDYLLTFEARERVDALFNSTVIPFSDSIEATLTGDAVPAPEPGAGLICALFLAAIAYAAAR